MYRKTDIIFQDWAVLAYICISRFGLSSILVSLVFLLVTATRNNLCFLYNDYYYKVSPCVFLGNLKNCVGLKPLL